MSDEPLTLERLAQLDAAASPGPYCSVHFEGTSWVCATDPPLTGDQDSDTAEFDVSVRVASCDEEPERAANATFLAASKGSAPALLRGLVGLAADWTERASPNSDYSEGVNDGFSRAARDLTNLIATLDLGGDTPDARAAGIGGRA